MSELVSLCDYVQFVTGFDMAKHKETWEGLKHNLMKRII
jgi:hypothetical protein